METYIINDKGDLYYTLAQAAKLCSNESARGYSNHGIYKTIRIVSPGVCVATDGICAMCIHNLPADYKVGVYNIRLHDKYVELTESEMGIGNYSLAVTHNIINVEYNTDLPVLDMTVCNRGLQWKNMAICNWIRSHNYSVSVEVFSLLVGLEWVVSKCRDFVRFRNQIYAIEVFTSINI